MSDKFLAYPLDVNNPPLKAADLLAALSDLTTALNAWTLITTEPLDAGTQWNDGGVHVVSAGQAYFRTSDGSEIYTDTHELIRDAA